MTKSYNVFATSGQSYGIYQGSTEEEAIFAMLRDGGADEGQLMASLPSFYAVGTVLLDGKAVDMDAVRAVMDDELCEQIHGTVDDDQQFLDAYLVAHEAKYGTPFAFN